MGDIVAEVLPESAIPVGAQMVRRACEVFDQHLLDQVLRFGVRAGEDIELEFKKASGLPVVSIDPGQLESALLNLCINARDAMPEGGTLRIATENATLGNEAARELSLPPGRHSKPARCS